MSVDVVVGCGDMVERAGEEYLLNTFRIMSLTHIS